jgi:hypothetical protein
MVRALSVTLGHLGFCRTITFYETCRINGLLTHGSRAHAPHSNLWANVIN